MTVRMEHALLADTVGGGVVFQIVPAPVVACMMKVRAVVGAAISPVMVRLAVIEERAVGVVDVHPEAPSSACKIDRTVKVLGVQEPAVLRFAQYPAKVIVADIQRFVVIVQCPFGSIGYVFHNVAYGVYEVVVDFIHVVVLQSAQAQFVGHLVGEESRFFAHLAHTHRCHGGCSGSHPDGDE